MQKETLKYINDELVLKGIPYEFTEFTASIESLDEYWVGEYQEIEPLTEDGQEESQFILTGTARTDNALLILETTKQKIREAFPALEGSRAILENNSGVAIFYGNAIPVPTGDALLKRLQINLKVKEWRVN